MNPLNAGIFAVGLDTYWPQFAGLRDRLCGYLETIASRIEGPGVRVLNAGMVDSPGKAIEAADRLRAGGADIVFLFVSTYALSATVLPVAQRVKAPLIVLNLAPARAIDYEAFNRLGDRGKMTGEWLAHCQACAVPEIASVLNRAKLPYQIVTGWLDDPEAWDEIGGWIEAARVVQAMRNNTLGLLGRYYNGMLDVYSDLTKLSAVLGTRMEILEMCELKKERDAATPAELEAKRKEFRAVFDVAPDCSETELDRAALTSVALDRLVAKHGLTSVAFYYEGEDGNEYEDIVTSVIAGNTLLTGRHVPVAGEYEVKNAHAMKIMDAFGAGGAFSEFYALDFNDDIVLLGHDGPAHFQIAEGRVQLTPLPVYHGKPGKGLSIQMTVKHGPVTLLSVVETEGGLQLLVAEGESVPGPVLKIGNTNSRYRFSPGAKAFVNAWSRQGPSHHCAIGLGHIAGKIGKFGTLMNIPVIRIC